MILLLYFVKASVVMLATAAALLLAGRRASAAARHLVCALAVGGLLTLPILSVALPRWVPIHVSDSEGTAKAAKSPAAAGHYVSLAGPAEAGPHVTSAETVAGHDALSSFPWQLFALLVYGSGVLLLLARLLLDWLKARRLALNTPELNDPEWQMLFCECASELEVKGHVRLLRSPERTTPMAIGVRHRAIVLPALADAWSGDLRRAVLRHEFAHVARRDCFTQAAVAFACALYWLHPGSWWLARRLRIERELACDDLVVSAGTDAHDYAGHLLELTYTLRGRLTPAFATGMAAPSQIESRMLSLLDGERKRTAPSRLGRAVVIGLFVVALLPIAAATVDGVQASSDVTPAAQTGFARDVRSEWLRRFLTVDYWRQVANYGLSRLADQANYLSEMRKLGYSVADANVLFTLRQHGVTPDFVRGLASEGLSGLSTDDLLKAVRHGITPGYVRELKEFGFWPLDIEALTRVRSHGIDGEFIGDVQTFGYRWSIDELVQARSHGIDPDYLLAISSLGYQHLTLEDLTLLRSHGVTPMKIQSANLRAATHLSVQELTTLASHGWRP